ncbi:MAG: hypothetical protein LJE91_00635 [Gammaproteobacteria bacterium]|nr:hypothetical protein [Gammaproteobacteria bacterium]
MTRILAITTAQRLGGRGEDEMVRPTDESTEEPVDETSRQLAGDPLRGLSVAQAAARLRRYGDNEIQGHEV